MKLIAGYYYELEVFKSFDVAIEISKQSSVLR
jgi:hypothetical protein